MRFDALVLFLNLTKKDFYIYIATDYCMLMMMFKLFIIVLPIIGAVIGHDTYTGTCPKFQGMSGFDWNKVSK